MIIINTTQQEILDLSETNSDTVKILSKKAGRGCDVFPSIKTGSIYKEHKRQKMMLNIEKTAS